jgi:hypothetical protein
MNDKREMLRHCLATLAYRGAKVLRDTPEGFAEFRPSSESRSAGEVLAHLGDLLDWASCLARGTRGGRNTQPLDWQDGVERFFVLLRRLDGCLISEEKLGSTEERLFQGPVADALTHVGQLAMLRRLAGAPVRGENYFKADIAIGRVTAEQSAPRAEFD